MVRTRLQSLWVTTLAVAIATASTTSFTSSAHAGEPVLMPVPAEPTISAAVWFKVGAQNDPVGKEGLAWVTATLMAEGATTKRSYEEILAALFPMAASYSASVDREMTVMRGRVHKDHASALLDLFVDAWGHPAFDPKDFERVRRDGVNAISKGLRYASDEELGKAALHEWIFEGTRYAHPINGTIEGLEAITLADVKGFYAAHYTAANATLALGGGYDAATLDGLKSAVAGLAPGSGPTAAPVITPQPIQGRSVRFVQKDGADASISFGFPIPEVHRGSKDFYALWIANSWLGEHRNGTSHLYQVIREARGMNYGDYSYIEDFPNGGRRQFPPTNVARRHQIFQVWIRTLPNERAHFALRAAVREVEDLISGGMTAAEFELTRTFVSKYSLHFAETTSARLGYAIDDVFYGIDEGHLKRFRRVMAELTVEDVNKALKRHLDTKNMKIAMVTGDAPGLSKALPAETESPIEYDTPKSDEVMAEDKKIGTHKLSIGATMTTPVDEIFQRASDAPATPPK